MSGRRRKWQRKQAGDARKIAPSIRRVPGKGAVQGHAWKRTGAIALFVLVLLSFAAVGFTEPGPLQVELAPREALVGDPVKLTLIVPGTTPDRVVWPVAAGEKLGELEVLSADTLSNREARKAGGAGIVYTVAAYDTGRFSSGELVVHALPLQGGDGVELTAEARELRIRSVLAQTDSLQHQFKPLKAQEELPITFWDIVRWVGPWLALIAGVLLLVYLARRFLQPKERDLAGKAEKPLPPPYDEAVAALARLKLDNPLARGEFKAYVSGLTRIVKRLLERVHEDPVLEMTTGEVRTWVRHSELRCRDADVIRLLDASDTVKFAKGLLAGGGGEELFATAERIVSAYRPSAEETSEDSSRKPDEPAGTDAVSGSGGGRTGKRQAEERRKGSSGSTSERVTVRTKLPLGAAASPGKICIPAVNEKQGGEGRDE